MNGDLKGLAVAAALAVGATVLPRVPVEIA